MVKKWIESYRENKELKRIKYCLNQIDNWEWNNCYDWNNPRCEGCLSGGMFWGSFCTQAYDEYGLKEFMETLPKSKYKGKGV